jgi:hypothetical protein
MLMPLNLCKDWKNSQMNSFADQSEAFDSACTQALSSLLESYGSDAAVKSLAFAEEARRSSSSDEYAPDWFQPFVSMVAGLHSAQPPESQPGFMIAAIVRAIQLGYTEGYFAAKDD